MSTPSCGPADANPAAGTITPSKKQSRRPRSSLPLVVTKRSSRGPPTPSDGCGILRAQYLVSLTATLLALRDEGRVVLDEPAATYADLIRRAREAAETGAIRAG